METTKVQDVEQPIGNVQSEVRESNYDAIIKRVVADGAKRLKGLHVKNVNFTEKDNYSMVSFTLSEKVMGFVRNEADGSYQQGLTNVIFTSLYAICGALKEDEDKAWMANHLLLHPKALTLLFAGGTVDILQQEVSAGKEYRNPFTTREFVEPQVYDHDVIINNIIKFKFGKMGEIAANRLMDKMLDE